MNFQTVIERYRRLSFSERDKGNRFENLIKGYLQTEPVYKSELKTVWLWKEFPYRQDFGGQDLGIDLVAQTFEGGYWAIQCKCYKEEETIDKPALDTFLSTSSRRFSDSELTGRSFDLRLFFSTTNKWTSAAEETLLNQTIPVKRIGLSQLTASLVDWEALDRGIHGDGAIRKDRELLDHQKVAVDKFHEHFLNHDRGRLIMACGTGKTFTSLKIAENEYPHGLVLFLVPSISLLGQALGEWTTFAKESIKAVCICSDAEVSKRKKDSDDISSPLIDLAFPASTDVKTIVKHYNFKRKEQGGMTVVFSTYQSIGRVSEVQKALNQIEANSCIFDLIVCDEAHRTTGYSLREGESAFMKVHDNDFIEGKKRLYMTATPRLYKLSDEIKNQLTEADAYLCSMDDESMYGKEVYRIGFGEAVARKLLSDYKVLTLTVRSSEIPLAFQEAIKNSHGEIETDDISKLIGCINALSKRTVKDDELIRQIDPGVMHTAVAYCQSIPVATHITEIFNEQKELFYESLNAEERAEVVNIEADHVNGKMSATMRQDKLAWLKSCPHDSNHCHILTNVRCLSEGVDVPSLDAVMFLSARNSEIDVVQSVGRVMRRAEGKKYGYIIIPVVIPEDMEPEEALEKSDCYKVVWSVLKALRAHDDRFDSKIAKLDLNKLKGDQFLFLDGNVNTIGKGHASEEEGDAPVAGKTNTYKMYQQELAFKWANLKDKLYAQMVKKVGTRKYWELWAKDVADVAKRYTERIRLLISQEGPYKTEFDKFQTALRANLNPSVSQDEIIEMLSQHIITKPVFEALFEDYSFVNHNPVSISMQRMIELLHDNAPDAEIKLMDNFYESIKERVRGIDNAEGRQKVIIELYDKFFKAAFPDVVSRLGIVYTPVQIVDFMLRAVEILLQTVFKRSLSDENVHVLDPFTGTGTYITRLLQIGILKQECLQRKYLYELHANEIVLLAYYIASINIENVYHELSGENQYTPFDGICLTDTFQLGEPDGDNALLPEVFHQNSERVIRQKKAPIRVIVGNPPYSIGQRNANDNAQNQAYPFLEQRIAETYARDVDANNLNSLYNTYIKAFRWASDRIGNNDGIIAYITNSGWLDTKASAGFRRCLAREFDAIYVLDLRGGIRGKSGDAAKKEGQNVFDIMTGVAITILVKKAKRSAEEADIYYYKVNDYLNRKEKLALLSSVGNILDGTLKFSTIRPNAHGDWLSMRNDKFSSFISIGEKLSKEEQSATNVAQTFFEPVYSNGLKTQRDAWCYNSSLPVLSANIAKTIEFYNTERARYHASSTDKDVQDFVTYSPNKGSWTTNLLAQAKRNQPIDFHEEKIVQAMYRPFFKQYVYFDSSLNERVYQNPKLFPTPEQQNLLITIPGLGGVRDFYTLITNCIRDLDTYGGTQCFPRYYYTKVDQEQMNLFDKPESQYIRHDAITDFILARCREMYGPRTTKDDIFYYVYGLLHSREYRETFAADLKKELPRLPLVEEPKDFKAFAKAGRELSELHLCYETLEPLEDIRVEGELMLGNDYTVSKMQFAKVRNHDSGKMEDDLRTIIYNRQITVTNIPQLAYEYVLNGKSAIEWVMERYQVSTDDKTGITNNPNDWGREHNDERYILRVLLGVITASVRTVEIISKLPKLTF